MEEPFVSPSNWEYHGANREPLPPHGKEPKGSADIKHHWSRFTGDDGGSHYDDAEEHIWVTQDGEVFGAEAGHRINVGRVYDDPLKDVRAYLEDH